MKIPYPETLAAVQKGERVPWAVGDALLDEITGARRAPLGSSDGLGPEFERCAKMLADFGYRKYDPKTLRKLRTVAASFPVRSRHYDIPWGAHETAATPENLEQAIKSLHGKVITAEAVRVVFRAWRRKDAEARKRAAAKAKEEADAEERKARKNKKDEEAAARARQKRKEAEEAESRAAKAPTTREIEGEPPTRAELEIETTCMTIEADAQMMTKKLRDNLDKIEELGDRLDADFVQGIIDHHQKMIKAATAIIDRLNKRTRFGVIQGGAA